MDRRRPQGADARSARSSTRCTSARSRPKARGRPRPRELAELARIGITIDRDDADRRVSRALRLGLRRRRSLRATRTSTARPTICARFVDRAHALGLGVILDVVYNHLGPDGNYLAEFSPDYFTDKYTERLGTRDQLRRAGAGARATSCRTRATGSTSSISTVCVSTRRRTSRTRRRDTSSRR